MKNMTKEEIGAYLLGQNCIKGLREQTMRALPDEDLKKADAEQCRWSAEILNEGRREK